MINIKEKKNIFKLVAATLCLAAIVLCFFNIAKITVSSTKIQSYNGFNLFFGLKFDEKFSGIEGFNFNFGLALTIFLTIFSGILLIVDFKKYDFIKRGFCLISSVFCFAHLSNIVDVLDTLYNQNNTFSLTNIGKAFVIVISLVVLANLFDLYFDRPSIPNMNNKAKMIAKIALTALVLCGLFIPVFRISNTTNIVTFNFANFIGSKQYTLVNSTSLYNSNSILPALFFFIYVLGNCALSIVGYETKNKIFTASSFILIVFAFIFIIRFEDTVVKAFNTSTASTYFSTLYAVLIKLSVVALLVISIVDVINVFEKKEICKLALVALSACALSLIYKPAVYSYLSMYSTPYNKEYITFANILKGVDVGSNDTKPLVFIISYALLGIGMIAGSIPFKKEKQTNLLISLAYLGSAIALIYGVMSAFECVDTGYYTVTLYGCGYFILAVQIINFASYLYMGAKNKA